MSSINFQRKYFLGEAYESILERVKSKLAKYWGYPDQFIFNEKERSVTYSTEKLIPNERSDRPRVMLLFSNPHPHSVKQGMFLSPNTRGRVSLFWPVMENAGWLWIPYGEKEPKDLANLCLQAKYQGPFEFVFYCYYAFPTDYPEDIQRIFGRKYFNQVIVPEAEEEFQRTIQETEVEAVVTFNKGIFNLVSQDPVRRYLHRLNAGELVQSQVKVIDKVIPIFLTYPTGWRYHREYMQYRKSNLDKIREALGGGIVKDRKNT